MTTAEAFARANILGLARPFIRLNIAESLRGQGNLQQMSRLEEPLLLLVGSKGDVTPASLSRELFAASTLPTNRKRLTVVGGAGHNDVLTHAEALRLRRLLAGDPIAAACVDQQSRTGPET